MSTELTRREYLTLVAVAAGAHPFAAAEAVASVAIEHPEWDMDERATLSQWQRRPPDQSMLDVLP